MRDSYDLDKDEAAVSVGSDRLLADLKRARSRLYRMELHARKYRGNNATYTEGKCEGESIGLRFALREIDDILRSANNAHQPTRRTDVNITDRSDHSGASPELAVGAGFGIWQDIETAPRDGTTILAHYPSKVGYVARQDIAPIHWSGWGGGVWENSNSGMKPSDQPTHWMPLPPLPNTQGSRAEERE